MTLSYETFTRDSVLVEKLEVIRFDKKYVKEKNLKKDRYPSSELYGVCEVCR